MTISRSVTTALAVALACACGEPQDETPAAPEIPALDAAVAAPSSSASAAPPAAPPARPDASASDTSRAKPAVPAVPAATNPDAPEPAQPDTDATTYNQHVQPILARACVTCHSEGQIAPFALDSYELAKPLAAVIATVTRTRTMPPSVVDNSGACNTFRDLPWLSDEEIATIARWSEQGAPQGAAANSASEPRALPKLSGDIKTLTTPSYVPSTAKNDDWRCFVVESPITEPTFVTGYDTRPGDPKTAHHMVVFYPMDDLSAALAQVLDDSEEGPGYTCFGSPSVPATVIAAWAPGGGATLYPDKLGVPVEAHRPMIIQMHYNTAGLKDPGADSTQIDFQVESQGISPGAFVQVLDLEMSLPPGRTEAEEVVQVTVNSKLPEKTGPVEVYGVFPHMHELGRTLKLTVDRNGGEECMLDAPRYSFHWQRMYFFDKPLTVDAADPLSARCVFDTTSRMTETVWGESTQDEMCVAGLFVKL
jgi:mono/diheme cytochrome c family protein